jgi:hypothetical protein
VSITCHRPSMQLSNMPVCVGVRMPGHRCESRFEESVSRSIISRRALQMPRMWHLHSPYISGSHRL